MAEENKKNKQVKEEKQDKEKSIKEKAKEMLNKSASSSDEGKKKKDEKVDTKDVKPELEREYVIPLRRKVQKSPRYKRAKKAVKVIREFLAKHMKVEDRDLKKIKIDKFLNHELWFRGIKKPPAKIKIKAKKIAGVVYAELAEIPEKVKWDMAREKKKEENEGKIEKKVVKDEKDLEKKVEKSEEEKQDESEKEKASVEAGLEKQKQEAKDIKHTSKQKQPKQEKIQRKALKR